MPLVRVNEMFYKYRHAAPSLDFAVANLLIHVNRLVHEELAYVLTFAAHLFLEERPERS